LISLVLFQVYISGLKVAGLRGNMRRKWGFREGTLTKSEQQMEEEEIRMTNLKTQDDVVRQLVKIG
jgi:hypothetical protein